MVASTIERDMINEQFDPKNRFCLQLDKRMKVESAGRKKGERYPTKPQTATKQAEEKQRESNTEGMDCTHKTKVE